MKWLTGYVLFAVSAWWAGGQQLGCACIRVGIQNCGTSCTVYREKGTHGKNLLMALEGEVLNEGRVTDVEVFF